VLLILATLAALAQPGVTTAREHSLAACVDPRDAAAGLAACRRAAAGGNADAAFFLGRLYWDGSGVPRDEAEAARWFRVAHDGGRGDAAFMLGAEAMARVTRTSTCTGDYDHAALIEALRWLDLAATTDPSEANRARARAAAVLLRQMQANP
jgi:hypothetical protein